MIVALIVAVIATDIAVAVMFLLLRRHLMTPPAAGLDDALSAEMEGLVVELRAQLEQASAELAREKAQLRRMLAEAGRRQEAPPPAVTRRDVLNLAAEGHSFRAIAARTGMSVEEVRLMLALEQEALAA
jgi:DNA-binding NarL/FixJ family response regulator